MGADAVTRTIKTVRAIPFMLRVLFPSKPAKWVSLSLRQPTFPGNRLFFIGPNFSTAVIFSLPHNLSMPLHNVEELR